MTISITKRELEAIYALYDEVSTNYEAASDGAYLETTGENLEYAMGFISKCRDRSRVDYVARRIRKRGGRVNKKWILEQLDKED